MKLKEIKPGMVIHWKTKDEKVALLEELERLGYEWNGTEEKPTEAYDYIDMGHAIYVNNDNGYKNITHGHFLEKVTHNFSDLIIPEPELSAEEVLLIARELSYDFIHDFLGCCQGYTREHMLMEKATPKQVIDMCKKWKADHEKKEPEIETVDICRIIEVLPDGKKRCVHEEDIKSDLPFGGDEREKVEKTLKRYCMEHDGEFIAVHEVVSRVKEAE